jgi:hypothetical protein
MANALICARAFFSKAPGFSHPRAVVAAVTPWKYQASMGCHQKNRRFFSAYWGFSGAIPARFCNVSSSPMRGVISIVLDGRIGSGAADKAMPAQAVWNTWAY